MILILFLLPSLLSAPPPMEDLVILQTGPLNNLEAIWFAVCQVESGNDPDAFCWDVNGQPSVGIAQIQPSRIRHYNKLTGHSYTLADCFNAEISKEVFFFFARKIGNEDRLIKSWNGSGPATEIYLQKVKRYL